MNTTVQPKILLLHLIVNLHMSWQFEEGLLLAHELIEPYTFILANHSGED